MGASCAVGPFSAVSTGQRRTRLPSVCCSQVCQFRAFERYETHLPAAPNLDNPREDVRDRRHAADHEQPDEVEREGERHVREHDRQRQLPAGREQRVQLGPHARRRRRFAAHSVTRRVVREASLFDRRVPCLITGSKELFIKKGRKKAIFSFVVPQGN